MRNGWTSSRRSRRDEHKPTSALLVCNANRCRSVLTEWCLEVALRDRGAEGTLALAGAGLVAVPGEQMLPECAEIIKAAAGSDSSRYVTMFRSRAVTDRMLCEADIVVTMTRRELFDVLRIRPQAIGSTVTLLELARAAEDVPTLDAAEVGDRLIELLVWTVWHRARLTPSDPNANDIADPVGGPASAFAATATRIADAVERIATCLVYERVKHAAPVRWPS